MTETEALSKMIAPSQVRPSKPYRGGVIQIHVTRACDKSCFSCTQGSNLAGKAVMITPEQFEIACKSLKGYWGVIGLFGGNPCMHKEFPVLCEILRNYFPKEVCGLWSNNLIREENGKAAQLTFNPGYSNLNVHLDQQAFTNFQKWWPESRPFGLDRDSRHSPPFVAMKDILKVRCTTCIGRNRILAMIDPGPCPVCNGPYGSVGMIYDKETAWELISKCDINQHWSAMVCVVRDKVVGYFCEIAGGQAMLHENDPDWPETGLLADGLYDGKRWWELGMRYFVHQVRQHCHSCGVPLRGYGQLSQAPETESEQVTLTHLNIYKPKRNLRPIEVVDKIEQIKPQTLERVTHYLQNGAK